MAEGEVTLATNYPDLSSTGFEVELPGVYFDAVIQDTVSSGLVLTNRTPENGEVAVPLDQVIGLDIADLSAAGVPDLTNVQVYVAGVLVFENGTFSPGWDGPGSAASFVQADVLRIRIDYTSIFTSKQVIPVRVVCASTSGSVQPIDATYAFTCVDASPPLLLTASAIELQRVRATTDENVLHEDPTATNDALNPANWELERLGDGLNPVVFAKVVSVEAVSDNEFDLITNIPLTPGGTYRVYATNFTDGSGNIIVAPFNQVIFTGWQPPQPEGRVFDMFKMLPDLNRGEDRDTQDLYRFIACLQEVAGLLLYDVDRFLDILDPDTAPEEYIDLMLADLGNPFEFDLSLSDKRRLTRVLVDMYRLKGTAVGIQQVILFFMGLVVDIDAYNVDGDTLILGESELGEDWILGPGDSYGRYSFQVNVAQILTPEQRAQLTEIVEYMKPAHTHFVRLVEPETPTVIDHLELGLSELGDEWILH